MGPHQRTQPPTLSVTQRARPLNSTLPNTVSTPPSSPASPPETPSMSATSSSTSSTSPSTPTNSPPSSHRSSPSTERVRLLLSQVNSSRPQATPPWAQPAK